VRPRDYPLRALLRHVRLDPVMKGLDLGVELLLHTLELLELRYRGDDLHL